MMRIVLFILAALGCLTACNNGNKAPDVSGIPVQLTVLRFEKDFFALDTTRLNEGLDGLRGRYPGFFTVYLGEILGIDGAMIQSGQAEPAIRSFINTYKKLYDSTAQAFGDFGRYEAAIKKGLQYTKHYFPAYMAPDTLITFIGPMDAAWPTSFGVQSDVLMPGAFGVGLQLHLGSGFSYYQSEQGQQLYPNYISARFEPDYIAVNCLRLVVDELLPDNNDDKPMVQQMVQRGKRLYLLSQLLPDAPEYRLIGYTEAQLKDCYAHETNIWDLFVQNNYLQVADKNIVKNYIGEGPKTQELGEAAPGNIGSFAGWQIVKKFMAKNPGLSLEQLIAKDNEQLFQEAKYKP
jgi:hypothetical protein